MKPPTSSPTHPHQPQPIRYPAKIKPQSTIKTSHQPQAQSALSVMRVTPSDDSCSDADTQEPTNLVTHVKTIEDSDEEAAATPKRPTSAAAKMRQIVNEMNDADSVQSEEEDPLPADATVDFGDEEEVDDSKQSEEPESAVLEEGGHDADDDVKIVDTAEKDAANGKNDGKEEVEKPVVKKVADTTPKKKGRSKKEKEAGPVKTIKKTTTEAKGKAKAPKSKGAALVRKKDPSSKVASTKEKKTSSKGSTPSSQQTSPKKSPKPSKKTVSKVAKGASKATGRTSSKTDAAEKAAKPKKVIAKKEKGDKKVAVKKEDKKPVVKTFSKKGKTLLLKTPTKPKKTKSETKPKKGKSKAKSATKSSEEEEDGSVDADSESEGSAEVDSSDAEMEEAAMTPASKLPILGNLACSSRDGNCTALLDHAIEQLGKYNVVSYGFDSDIPLVAYIIGKDTKRGWGLLQALAYGIPLVSDEWLSTSISEGKWKPMDMFRSDRFGQSPRTVSGSAVDSGKLLEGVRVKVVCKEKDEPSVRKMVRVCGARVAETRMDVVINDTGKQVTGSVNVVKKWLADSIEAGMPLDYGPYVIKA